jgi:hypothetical protein
MSATTNGGPSHTSSKAMHSMVSYEVWLLDGHPITVNVSKKATGQDLLNEVFESMNPPLEERDYFSLTYDAKGKKIAWLDRSKNVEKQLKYAEQPAFALNVKFYPADPTSLLEYTRYLFYLQIRDDVATGKLPCSAPTQALLGSYLAQADLGDFTDDVDERELLSLPLCAASAPPEYKHQLVSNILSLYRTHRGLTTAEAETNYLEVAKKLTFYGVTLVPCTDACDVRISMGVNASGILVFREQLRLNRFAWARIGKIAYKKSEFTVSLTPGDYEGIEKCVVFKMDSHKEAKRFWKICKEHHHFFRLLSANPNPRRFFSLKSKSGVSSPQTEYEIKKSATLNRNDTFPRGTYNSNSYRAKSLTLDTAMQAPRRGAPVAPPSPQSGEYEPNRPLSSRNDIINDNHPNNSHNSHPAGWNGREDNGAVVTTTVKTTVRVPPGHPPSRLDVAPPRSRTSEALVSDDSENEDDQVMAPLHSAAGESTAPRTASLVYQP